MFGRDVVGGHVARTGAAGQRQRRAQAVTDAPDGALRARLIHQDACGIQLGEIGDHALVVRVHPHRMAHAPAQVHGLARVERRLVVVAAVQGKHRHQDLVRQRVVGPHTVLFGHNQARPFRYRKSRAPGQHRRRLAHRFGPHAHVVHVEAHRTQGFAFGARAKIGVPRLEQRPQPIGHVVLYHQRLFAGADRAVVKRLGVHDAPGRVREICRRVDEHRYVARAYAKSGGPRLLGQPHNRAGAGGDDQGQIGMAHHVVDVLGLTARHHLDRSGRRARTLGSFGQDTQGFLHALARAAVGTEDHRVSRLHADERLEDRR